MKNKNWLFAFALLIIVSIAGILMPNVPYIDSGKSIDSGDTAWMLIATALVLLMTPGLAFFYGGMVNSKNVVSTMLQSFICMGVISLLWVTVGFSLAFGESIGGIIGNPFTYFMFRGVGGTPSPIFALTVPFVVFTLYQMMFAIITPALITGALAERVRFSAYLLFISLFSLLIYCPLAHMVWHPEGILFKLGVLDFAGGTVVHISAGITALVGAIFLGKRRNKSSSPANTAFVLLGTGLLWFGWFGFNAGSALGANGLASLAFANTTIAAASAGLAWVLLDTIKGRRISAMGVCIGTVVGLVAITPAAGFVSLGSALFIGTVSAIISNYFCYWKSKVQIDDTLDVFPCHGIGGISGMLLTSILAKEEFGGVLATGDSTLLVKHILGLFTCIAFISLGSYALYYITNLFIKMRVREVQEAIGLDLAQHEEVLENTI